MNIRHAQSSDFPLIAAVQSESWQDAYSGVLPEAYIGGQISEDLRRHWDAVEIQSGDVVLVAEDDEISGIIGFIAIWCRPDPFIDNLHVKPSRRSQKIGTTLLISAVQLLMHQGHKTAYLWVVESNIRAIRFYERLGGVCTDRALKNLYGHAVLNIKIEFNDLHQLVRFAALQ
jgi:ribosomal protein S18 acetylase RimI-like enzyme